MSATVTGSVVFLSRLENTYDFCASGPEYRHLGVHTLPKERRDHMVVPVGDEVTHLGDLMPIHIVELLCEVG